MIADNPNKGSNEKKCLSPQIFKRNRAMFLETNGSKGKKAKLISKMYPYFAIESM